MAGGHRSGRCKINDLQDADLAELCPARKGRIPARKGRILDRDVVTPPGGREPREAEDMSPDPGKVTVESGPEPGPYQPDQGAGPGDRVHQRPPATGPRPSRRRAAGGPAPTMKRPETSQHAMHDRTTLVAVVPPRLPGLSDRCAAD